MAEGNQIEEENTTSITIDPVILTPEVVDDFRLNFDNPSEALGRDLVETMKMDYAEQVENDPNFITWEGLTSGRATIFDFLDATKDKSPMERALTADQAVVMFSNAEPATFARPFLSEFFKGVPVIKTMEATARAVGPRIIPSLTAAGAAAGTAAGTPGGPFGMGIGAGLGTGLGFTAGVLATGGVSFLTGGAVYLLGDLLEEKVMGPDAVITPGQRAEYEAYRTLGGAAAGTALPWLMSPASNLAGSAMLKNIADDAARSRANSLVSGLDRIISTTGKAARKNPKLTGAGEVVAGGGSAVGAYTAESMDPGATGTRLVGEIVGGMGLYATLAKALPRIVGESTEVGGRAVTGKQQKLFTKINEAYAEYGTPEQYDQLIENLTSPEMTRMLEEAFPGVDFTAAQRGGDPLLMAVEATKAQGEPALDAARKQAGNQANQFINNFIKGLISDGDPENIRRAATLRKSLFEDMLRNGLQEKMTRFLEANRILAAQPGQSAPRSQQELSEQLYEMVGDYMTAQGEKERALWGKVPNIEVIFPMSPDTALADLPAFLRVFEEVSYGDPSVQKQFKKASPVLFDFIETARRELGLLPEPALSGPEIASLEKFKADFDQSVLKLSGSESEGQLTTILENANALPLSERPAFFRKALESLKESPSDFTGRLKVSLEKAADYSAAQVASANRSAQRAGEVSEDVAPMTANRLAEVRSKLLRQARSLAADPATTDEARRIGRVAEAISQDLDVDGFGAVFDEAREFTRAKHDFFTRTVVGQIGETRRSGAPRMPPEVTFEAFVKTNPSLTLNRIRQLQAYAEFADQQGLPNYLPGQVLSGDDTVFTTTSNLVDSYLRGLKQVASKEVFDPKTNSTRTVINAAGLENWKAANKEVLEAFPQLKIDLDNAASAQRAVEVMEQNVKKGTTLARNQTDLAKLIDGMSPTVAVAHAFDSDTPVKAFRNLFALRRMGADRPRGLRSGRDGSFASRGALQKARTSEIQAAGLETNKINAAMGRAVLEHAYIKAGGEGSFNPQVFYKTLFERLPKSGTGSGPASQSLMDIADEFNIFPESVRKRLKFMTEQMMRVQAADAAGRLDDPDFVSGAGPILDFYVGVLGSAAGTRSFKMIGGEGPGVIAAAGTGARELRRFFIELPATAKLRAIDLMFTDPALIAALMQRPGTEKTQQRLSQKIVGMLREKLFNNAVSMTPFVVREGFEEEDRGSGSPLAEDPDVEIPALRERLQNEGRDLSGVNPFPVGEADSPVPVTAAPVSQAGPVDRTRFAALFPEDRELMGIGSLMEGRA